MRACRSLCACLALQQLTGSTALQTEAQTCLTLLLLGELGRGADLSTYPDAERCVVDAVSNSPDEVKATAALALGGIAVGNMAQYLSLLLGRVQDMRAASDASASQLYLLLKAVNEMLRSLHARAKTMTPGAVPLVCTAVHVLTRGSLEPPGCLGNTYARQQYRHA